MSIRIVGFCGHMGSGKGQAVLNLAQHFEALGIPTAVVGYSDSVLAVAKYLYPALSPANWRAPEHRDSASIDLQGRSPRRVLQDIANGLRLNDEYIWIRALLSGLAPRVFEKDFIFFLSGIRMIPEAVAALKWGATLVGLNCPVNGDLSDASEKEVDYILENLCDHTVPCEYATKLLLAEPFLSSFLARHWTAVEFSGLQSFNPSSIHDEVAEHRRRMKCK